MKITHSSFLQFPEIVSGNQSTKFLLQVVCLLGISDLVFCLSFNVTDDQGQGFTVSLDDLVLLKQTSDSPIAFVGTGSTTFNEDSGNFFIKDYTSSRIPLSNYSISCATDSCTIHLSNGGTYIKLRLFSERGQPLVLDIVDRSDNFDRGWLRVVAEADEEIYGGGAQYSYLNLRHRDARGENVFPIWTREQGVGRNKSTQVTFIADTQYKAGGDYHTTYFPQPTFVSSRRYFFHHDAYNYGVFDFSFPDFHEIFTVGKPGKIYFNKANSSVGVVKSLTSFLGMMPDLPDWIQSGAILAVQGGTSRMLSKYQEALDHHIPVAGLWIQDWSGKIDTPFGKRVHWNWKWDPTWYQNLDTAIQNLSSAGVRVLGYINPSLSTDGDLYKEAASKGYLVKNKEGNVYFGRSLSIIYGAVDLTNPAAFAWYKNVIKTNMIDLGLGGWMADFGEYLPVDAVLFDGRSGLEAHNEWPVLWAKLNREVVEEAGKLGEVVFFSRSGFSGISNYTTLMWTGDQNVDFSLADGIHSSIVGSLSMAMSGAGLAHFDIGGYTTFGQFGLRRTEELLLRSTELAVFTPVFRAHEGNQPEFNAQWYENGTISAFSVQAQHFALLKEYSVIPDCDLNFWQT